MTIQTHLPKPALEFVERLHMEFANEAQALVASRETVRAAVLKPDFLNQPWPPESWAGETTPWRVREIPQVLKNRRVEITGPAEPKMIINALNSGANVFMADFEDSLSPTEKSIVEGHLAIAQAYRRTIVLENPSADGSVKSYRLKTDESALATLILRPRGWHLPEPRYQIENRPALGALFDFGVSIFLSGKFAHETGRGPYYYLPKLESPSEAALWSKVFRFTEKELGLPQGSIRATVLIETLPAALQMEEIVFELRDHLAGLNAGRWDYLFSIIKTMRETKYDLTFPDRRLLTMDVPFMRRYAERLVEICLRRGAQPIGGMSALIPNRRDAEKNERALHAVTLDKEREARQGFVGTWVAHPDLVPTARVAFERVDNERKIGVPSWTRQPAFTRGALLPKNDEVPFVLEGQTTLPTLEGVRTNIDVSLRYISHWLAGTGAVAIHGLMEDAATAEISRSQLWQWRKSAVRLATGETVTADWLVQEIETISAHIQQDQTNPLSIAASVQDQAKDLFKNLVLQESFTTFLTLPAMDRI